MKLLAKFVHGSHLYSLNTPESDKDFKGVYMPEYEDLLLCSVVHSHKLGTNTSNTEKNTSEDVDYEVYSIHKWLEMLCKQDMVGFDMLYAPEECVEYYNKDGSVMCVDDYPNNPVWLVRNIHRDLFATTDMKGYVGYCNKQAAKYGVKGSRLHSLFKLQECLCQIESFDNDDRLQDYKHTLPETQFLVISEDHYEVLGKKHQWTTHLESFIKRIEAEIKRYGHRAIQAEKNEGIDWKAVSHAFRAGYQLNSMLLEGEMSVVLPPQIRSFIIQVKQGKLDWTSEVKPRLEQLMHEVEILCDLNPSGLPNSLDKEVVDKLIVNLITSYY